MYLLITGFEPFGGSSMNPAALAVQQLQLPQEIAVRRLIIPTVFGKAAAKIASYLGDPELGGVIMVGQAAGRPWVTPERVAINVRDARIADNEGNRPVDMPIAGNGPAAYFSTLPIKKIVAAVQSEGLPAAVSDTAGTFVCNDVFYSTLHALAQLHRAIPAGFIHVPAVPEQSAELPQGCPTMPLNDIRRALETAVKCVWEAAESCAEEG